MHALCISFKKLMNQKFWFFELNFKKKFKNENFT